MKKTLILFLLIIYVLFNNINSADAREYLKNFYGYEVKNVNIREFSVAAKQSAMEYDGPDKGELLKNIQNAIVYTGKNYTYFVKLYPANQNTHIFVVSNEKYDVHNNDITVFLQKNGYQYNKLEDKNALKEYQYDFYTFARKEQLGNFYVSPDLVKPLKTGVSKLNNHFSKHKKNTSAIPYTVDSDSINLTCIDTTSYYDTNAKLAIIRKEYRLKEKPNKFLHAFEYILTNKNNSVASISASTTEPIGLVEVTSETMVNWDKMDIIDMTCSCPPVVICTAGLSLIGSIPNWIRWAKLTKEATRYAHALPQNYQLKPQGYMRILVLKHKANPIPLNFHIKIQNQTHNIVF